MFLKKIKTFIIKIATAFILSSFISLAGCAYLNSRPGCGYFYGRIPPAQYLLTFLDKQNRPIDSVELIIRYDTLAHQKYSYNKFESNDPILSDSLGKMVFYQNYRYFSGSDFMIFYISFFVRYSDPDPTKYYCYFYKSGKLIYKQKLVKMDRLKANYYYKEINTDTMNLPEYFVRDVEMLGQYNVFEKKIVVKRKYTKR